MRRRTFVAGTAAAASLPSRFAIAQQLRVLRFVPHANLTLLDPIFTTATVTVNHGWAVYDACSGSITNSARSRRWQRATRSPMTAVLI